MFGEEKLKYDLKPNDFHKYNGNQYLRNVLKTKFLSYIPYGIMCLKNWWHTTNEVQTQKYWCRLDVIGIVLDRQRQLLNCSFTPGSVLVTKQKTYFAPNYCSVVNVLTSCIETFRVVNIA